VEARNMNAFDSKTDRTELTSAAGFAVGLGMLAAVWIIDQLVRGQVSMSILYLVPIGFAAWFCGGNWAYAMSFLAAAAWLESDLQQGRVYSHWLIPFWNAAVRLGFFVIVTALASAIKMLRELNRLERDASSLKSDVVTLVSHEFGNFLTTFDLNLTLLKESEDAEPSARRARCYATMERVSAHLNRAVAAFLDLHRVESGAFLFQSRRVSLNAIIHSVISELALVIERSRVALRLELPPISFSVRGDPDALSVVLTNLIGNAFKFTPAGGLVTVRVTATAGSPAMAIVSVEDTGIGIAQAEQKLVVSGKYRAEGGRRLAPGFGVGLKAAKDLLESQSSRLEIESEQGHGTRFSFRLPMWAVEAEP
jgi:signal transduction histidine kinase